MARWALCGGLVLLVSLSAVGHPAFVPTDPAAALVQSDPGRTTFALSMSPGGWSATLARSVSGACDIVAVIGTASLFDLRVRALVFPSLFPLHVALELGRDRLAVLGALHLGPVRLVGDRTWGSSGRVRVAIHVAGQRLAAAAALEAGARLRPIVSATWFPAATPLWSLSFVGTPDGLRVVIGGTW